MESGVRDGVIEVGATLPFRFDNGTVLELANVEEGPLNSNAVNDSVITFVPYTFALSPDQLTTMSTAKLDKVRLQIMGNDFDWDVKGGTQKSIMAATACMLSRM